MNPKWMKIVKKTAYGTGRPEGQADLGAGPEVTAVAEEAYDFRQDTHRKDILAIMLKTLLVTYGHASAAGILRQDMEQVLMTLDPEPAKETETGKGQSEIIWP